MKPDPTPLLKQSALLERLRSIELTPVTIRTMFILLTRIHYSTAENYGAMKGKLEKFIWHKEKEKRGILVDYDYNYNPKHTNERPAIFVGADDFTWIPKSVDANKGVRPDNSGQDYIEIGTTNVIIRHISAKPDETLALGDLSLMYFKGLKLLMQEQFQCPEYGVVALKSSRPFENASQQADTQFIVDLIIKFSFNSAWSILRESHRLKTVGWEHTVEFSDASKQGN